MEVCLNIGFVVVLPNCLQTCCFPKYKFLILFSEDIDHRAWFQTTLQCHITVNTEAHVQVLLYQLHFGLTPFSKSHAVIMQNENTTTAVVMNPLRSTKQNITMIIVSLALLLVLDEQPV